MEVERSVVGIVGSWWWLHSTAECLSSNQWWSGGVSAGLPVTQSPPHCDLAATWDGEREMVTTRLAVKTNNETHSPSPGSGSQTN